MFVYAATRPGGVSRWHLSNAIRVKRSTTKVEAKTNTRFSSMHAQDPRRFTALVWLCSHRSERAKPCQMHGYSKTFKYERSNAKHSEAGPKKVHGLHMAVFPSFQRSKTVPRWHGYPRTFSCETFENEHLKADVHRKIKCLVSNGHIRDKAWLHKMLRRGYLDASILCHSNAVGKKHSRSEVVSRTKSKPLLAFLLDQGKWLNLPSSTIILSYQKIGFQYPREQDTCCKDACRAGGCHSPQSW
jgi:hypothetical protein